MREIFKFLPFLLIFSSCSDDTPNESHEFLESIQGTYFLIDAVSETAVDINFDGIKNHDLQIEATCIIGSPPALYKSDIDFNRSANYKHLGFTFLQQGIDSNTGTINENSCIQPQSLYYEYDVNERDQTIVITGRNEEAEAVNGKLLDISWADGTITYILEKEYYTADGWQKIVVHLSYEKHINN